MWPEGCGGSGAGRRWPSGGKELEKENARLKRLLADAELEKDALREIAEGNF